MDFSISSKMFEGMAVIAVGGHVRGQGCGNLLWEVIYSCLYQGAATIMIDFAEAETVDDHALGHIEAAHRVVCCCGRSVTVINASLSVRTALIEAGLGPCLFAQELDEGRSIEALSEQSKFNGNSQ